MSIAVRSDGKDKGLFDYSIKEELSPRASFQCNNWLFRDSA